MTAENGTHKGRSLRLWGAVSMGTGVMIGAGIFALTGQVAGLAGRWFPFAFLLAAVVAGFSAYSYVVLAREYPSAGGIAMFLEKAYGRGTVAGACALLMYSSMVINESLVARTFGTYALRVFDVGQSSWLVPALGVGLLAFAFLVNILGNRVIQSMSLVMALLKVAGIAALAAAGLWASDLAFPSVSLAPEETDPGSFVAATALAVLAYKGFTTITNSGGEIVEPRKNVGRAIVIALVLCVAVYLLVTLAVGANLTLDEIAAARDYSLARAAEPAFGRAGVWITVAFAVIASVSGVIASAFAVSRMLAMLVDMGLAPHGPRGIPGSAQRHTLAFTIVAAMALTLLFDLARIAVLGAVFYLIMDAAVHWGVLRHLRHELGASRVVLITALVLDLVALGALLVVKAQTDPTVVGLSLGGVVAIVAGEALFLRLAARRDREEADQH